MSKFVGFVVGTADSLSVDPPRDTMSRSGEKQSIHRTIEAASAYKRRMEKGFCVPLVIYRGEFEEVEPVAASEPVAGCKKRYGWFNLK